MYSKLGDGSFIISGFVAQDSETKTSQNGKTYTKWGVKVGEKPAPTGERYGEAIWTNCIAWGSLAAYAGTIKKGDTVLCVGKISQSQHEGKTYKTLVCDYISIIPNSYRSQQAQPQQSQQQGNDFNYDLILDDGDTPF